VPKRHAVKTWWEGREVEFDAFLTSALDRGEWSASGPGRSTLKENSSQDIGEEAMWTPEPVWTQRW